MRVMGKDVETEMDDIRGITGICPQHNILFDELTCEARLNLFLFAFFSLDARQVLCLCLYRYVSGSLRVVRRCFNDGSVSTLP